MKPIRWGIIGMGRIAEKFATDLLTVPNSHLVAVASSSLERAIGFAQTYHVPNAFGSHEEIFQVDLDVIYIATPHTSHHEKTLLCLRNKVAVLCEKPFAMNFQQVQEMVDSAREKNVFLMEAMWTRFMPSILKTLELIKENRIGNLKTIHADFGFLAPYLPERRLLNKQLGGGALLDIGIYPTFISLLLLGYPIDIQGVTQFGVTDIDETTSFVFKYKEATAILNCTIAARTNSEAWIYGDKGCIQIHSRFHEAKKITLFEDDNEPIDFVFERETFGYNYEIEEVNKCLREGKKESDLMPLSMSLDLIKLLDEIRYKTGIVYPEFDFIIQS
jgi:predicted dehydrogenase